MFVLEFSLIVLEIQFPRAANTKFSKLSLSTIAIPMEKRNRRLVSLHLEHYKVRSNQGKGICPKISFSFLEAGFISTFQLSLAYQSISYQRKDWLKDSNTEE